MLLKITQLYRFKFVLVEILVNFQAQIVNPTHSQCMEKNILNVV